MNIFPCWLDVTYQPRSSVCVTRINLVYQCRHASSLNVWVPVMQFCVCPIHCRVHWRVGRRLGSCRLTSVQTFDRVNDLGILYKLCSVGIGGSVLSILT